MGIFDFLLSKDTRLQKAIEAKNVSEAIQLISDGANANTTTERGKTALWLAVERNSFKLAELLMSKNTDLNKTYEEGNTALLKALINKNKEITNLLINNNADTNKENNNGLTPLVHALETGGYETTEILINKGADINIKYNGDSLIWIPLSKNKNTKTVKLLLEKIIKLDQENPDGHTELMYAINNDENELVQLFIDNGADINYYSEESNSTPLSIAIYKGKLPIVQKLIDKKADINFYNKNTGTPIGTAISFDKLDILKLLIEKGADLNTKSGEFSYLAKAISNSPESIGMVKILVNNGADVNEEYRDKSHDSSRVPLIFAIDYGNEEAVKFLIENGAKLNFESNGFTPFTYALFSGNKNILALFEKQNLKPKATDYFNAARFSVDETMVNGDLTYSNCWPRMLQLLNIAIEMNPKFADAYGYRGLYYCAQVGYRQNPDLIAESLSNLNKAIKFGGSNPLFYFSRGVANDESGNVDAAIADYTAYSKSYPKGSLAYNNRGLLYKSKGNYQAAESDFTKKIEIDYNSTAGYINRANLYFELGREDDGVRDCEAGLKINPNNPTLVKNAGVYYYNQIVNNRPNHFPSKAMDYLKKSGWEHGDDNAKDLYNRLANRYGR